ncbi:hypothetical protein BTZ20_0702 [Rhodococcus sp. MTM3W5.2]|nr:hypothetical protein BTZ20_0702 [Rhodococcus sp. MTM3W5.2]
MRGGWMCEQAAARRLIETRSFGSRVIYERHRRVRDDSD